MKQYENLKMGNLKQYENLNMGNLKQFKPQDGKEDVTRSFVGPVVGGQGHLEGKISMGIWDIVLLNKCGTIKVVLPANVEQ